MKRHLLFQFLFFALCWSHAANAQSKSKTKTIQDKEGNSYSIKDMPGGLTWTTTNLKISVPGSCVYFNADSNVQTYGRLYSWQAAQEGCALLGKDWRLPTDAEWQQLAKAYGGIAGDSKDAGKAAYKALLLNGSSGFNALLGGRGSANKQYWQQLHGGYYWTATESNDINGWMFYFEQKSETVAHYGDAKKDLFFSVRCVRK